MCNRITVICAVVTIALTALGCGSKEWEITVENKSAAACAIAVKLGLDGSSSASVDSLSAGETVTLIGGSGSTVIYSVTLKAGGNETSLSPSLALSAGQRYQIVIDAQGNLQASTTAK